MSHSILCVLVALQVKHFLADFPLQNVYMLGKGKKGIDWILPLGAHCSVHMILSGMIIAVYNPAYLWLAIVEFFAHFMIDRMKATYKLPAGQWAIEEKGKYLSKYYLAFGLDQLAHGLCYCAMIYIMA